MVMKLYQFYPPSDVREYSSVNDEINCALFSYLDNSTYLLYKRISGTHTSDGCIWISLIPLYLLGSHLSWGLFQYWKKHEGEIENFSHTFSSQPPKWLKCFFSMQGEKEIGRMREATMVKISTKKNWNWNAGLAVQRNVDKHERKKMEKKGRAT